MSDLLKEVDEMMRQERLLSLWKEYGNYIIAGVLAIILAVALNQGYQAWHLTTSERTTSAIRAAMQETQPSPALVAYAEQQGGQAAALANILAANQDIAAGNPSAARAKLLAARNESRALKDTRDLATLQWVRLEMGEKNADAAGLRAALVPLMLDEGQPYAWSARLEAAVIAADFQHNAKEAVELLSPMLDHPALPESMRERAQDLTTLYQIRAQ